MDGIQERLESLERAAREKEVQIAALERGARRLRAWQAAALALMAVLGLGCGLPAAIAQQPGPAAPQSVEQRLTRLRQRLTRHAAVARFFTRGRPSAPDAERQVQGPAAVQTGDLTLTGNLYVVNGLGATNGNPHLRYDDTQAVVNGSGNVIVGYNENSVSFARSGSHNLVVGMNNGWQSYGGLVTGSASQLTAPFASVSGGWQNLASGFYTAVSGGASNAASGSYASVSGGQNNTASGSYASVSGGQGNLASGSWSAISGGQGSFARGGYSAVSAGSGNNANGGWSAVSGGFNHTAQGDYSTVGGGKQRKESDKFGWFVGVDDHYHAVDGFRLE